MDRAQRNQRGFFLEAQQKSRFCGVWPAVPTDGWARQVLGNQAKADDLWKLLVPIYGLDEPDPASAWRERLTTLDRRGEVLDSLRIGSLRFQGPGTDLTVGLMPRSRWGGGPDTSGNGRVFAPNLPTEEVFTTPDWRRTEGFVRATSPSKSWEPRSRKPVSPFSKDEWSTLTPPRTATSWDAFSGRMNSPTLWAKSPWSTPQAGSFSRGGFFTASCLMKTPPCHIALGSGYPTTVEGGRNLGAGELLALGCNVSRVHNRFHDRRTRGECGRRHRRRKKPSGSSRRDPFGLADRSDRALRLVSSDFNKSTHGLVDLFGILFYALKGISVEEGAQTPLFFAGRPRL